jgi:hypothetical protein
VPQLPERCLSHKAGIVRCCLNVWQSYRAGNINAYHLFLAHSLFLRYNINKILPL